VDRSRVYVVVGLSAGGAMAAAMLAAYPERFAGGAIVGVPYGCANTVDEALRVSRPPYCVDAENRPMLLACLR
jgi:poly(3-hydroxybutyrate) depolymerase